MRWFIGRQLPKGFDHPHEEVLACATGIRNSLEELEDPRFIGDMVTEFAEIESVRASRVPLRKVS